MKKSKKIFISALIITLFITGCGCKKKPEKTIDYVEPEGGNPIEEVVKNETQLVQGNYTFEGLNITSKGAMNYVNGKVTNNGNATKTIDVTLYLKTSEDLTLGKVYVTIENISKGETKDFSLEIMGDYTTVSKYIVEVTEK